MEHKLLTARGREGGGRSVQNLLKTNKDTNDFFAWFEQAANNNLAGARLLDELCQHYQNPQQMVDRIHDLEHHGDDISHHVYEQLNKVFMPPMDREDIDRKSTRLNSS